MFFCEFLGVKEIQPLILVFRLYFFCYSTGAPGEGIPLILIIYICIEDWYLELTVSQLVVWKCDNLNALFILWPLWHTVTHVTASCTLDAVVDVTGGREDQTTLNGQTTVDILLLKFVQYAKVMWQWSNRNTIYYIAPALLSMNEWILIIMH